MRAENAEFAAFTRDTMNDWDQAAESVCLRGCGSTKSLFEVTVEHSFAAGHYLRNYKGKCENPHGHNYKVLVTLQGQELDKAGLLLDFKDLKSAIKEVVARLDHQMINDIAPFTEINPSAENLARYFYQEANVLLRSASNGRVWVKAVTMFETDVTNATYYE